MLPEDTIKWDAGAKEWATISLPPKSQRTDNGAHSVLAIGYDDEKRRILCQNSWGPGKTDMFYMGYEWILDFDATADFWMLRLVAQDGDRGEAATFAREVKL